METFHAPLKKDLSVVLPLAEKVAGVHGDAHPELVRVFEIVRSFVLEMQDHLKKEENVLFPLMTELDELSKNGGKPAFHCGSVGNPIRRMRIEHGDFDGMFSEMRSLTCDFALPEGACKSYGALFSMLQKMDGELSSHAKYEEETLFPEAVKKESACLGE
ncbi:MAG: hemerythrin domain-containing protein [Patescibacteria group bacterium]